MPDQIAIQLILLAGIAVVAVLLTRSSSDARHQAIRRILLVGFVIVAVVSVFVPDWLTWLARRVGVGRGTDLLLYALVIAFLSSVATTFRRLSNLDRKITVLTRELALARARLDDAHIDADGNVAVDHESGQRAEHDDEAQIAER